MLICTLSFCRTFSSTLSKSTTLTATPASVTTPTRKMRQPQPAVHLQLTLRSCFKTHPLPTSSPLRPFFLLHSFPALMLSFPSAPGCTAAHVLSIAEAGILKSCLIDETTAAIQRMDIARRDLSVFVLFFFFSKKRRFVCRNRLFAGAICVKTFRYCYHKKPLTTLMRHELLRMYFSGCKYDSPGQIVRNHILHVR